MKKAFTLVTALLLSGLASIFGQSGSIVYEEVRKIEIKIEGEMAHLMENMPKEQTAEKVLYFSPEATIYMEPEKKESEDEVSLEGGGVGMKIMMGSPDNKFFVDLAGGSIIEQREFMTRIFLVESEIEQEDWKITGEQKMIMDYACMEATRTDTAGVVTRVWFAPTFPAKGGPSRFCTLPGMVLEVNIDDGKCCHPCKNRLI
ncbi:MAG: GLPGLI family protein [Bacteroidales bacterium]